MRGSLVMSMLAAKRSCASTWRCMSTISAWPSGENVSWYLIFFAAIARRLLSMMSPTCSRLTVKASSCCGRPPKLAPNTNVVAASKSMACAAASADDDDGRESGRRPPHQFPVLGVPPAPDLSFGSPVDFVSGGWLEGQV